MRSGVSWIVLFLCAIYLVSCVSAEISLTVNADFGNSNEDVVLQTVSGATNEFDFGDDARIPDNQNPDSYILFYSWLKSQGNKLAIDSWDSGERSFVLGFETVPTGQSGDLTLSWSFSSSSYDAVLGYCGTDESCTNTVDVKNMESYSSLREAIETSEPVYFSLIISTQAVPQSSVVPPVSGSVGGAGGGSSGSRYIFVDDSKLDSGVTENLVASDVLTFLLDKQRYNLTLNFFDNMQIGFSIVPTGQKYVLGIGQSVLIDANGDGARDIEVTYSNYSASYVKIELKKSSAGFIGDNIDKISQTIDETVTKFKIDPVFRKKVLISMFSVLIILIILIGLLIKMFFEKKR